MEPVFRIVPRMRLLSGHSIGRLGLTKKIFAHLFTNEAGVFQLKVGALNLAAVDGKFLRECAGGRQTLTRSNLLAVDLFPDLLPHLGVDGTMRIVFELDVHDLS
jgi:hypothetical protein